MKYCSHCGQEIDDEAEVCVHCGCAVHRHEEACPKRNAPLDVVIKVFMAINTALLGWLLLPLAWCIPMSVSVFRSMERGRRIGFGLKICTLLFVSRVAGILLICRREPADGSR